MHRNKVAPEVTMINGVPHMLAYVNRAEKDMLRRAGGTGLDGPDGIPAYGFWDTFKSNVSKAASNFARDISSAPRNIARDLGNMAKQVNNDFGVANNIAKNLTSSSSRSSGPGFDPSAPPDSGGYFDNPPANTAGNFADSVLNSGSVSDFLPPQYGGKADADNDGVNDITALNNIVAAQTEAMQNDPGGGSTQTGYVTSDGKVEGVVDTKTGTVSLGPSQEELDRKAAEKLAAEQAAAQAAADAAAQEAAKQAAAAEAKRQAELAAALGDRDAALASQMSSLSDAFGFGTDEYYGGLRDSYTSDNNQAFQTAYDDAMRGIYEGFKSAGLLTQSAVDQDKSKLGSANLSETNRLGTAAEEYARANRSFVDEGRTGIEGQLQGLAVDADTADAYRAQTQAINAFDVAGASKPFQTPTERSVADFFSDFAKRSYDPSYNVAPTAVASAGPSRVTQSVNQFGPNTQTSSQVGIRSPFANKQSRVVS